MVYVVPLGDYPIKSPFIGHFPRGDHMKVSTSLYRDDDDT